MQGNFRLMREGQRIGDFYIDGYTTYSQTIKYDPDDFPVLGINNFRVLNIGLTKKPTKPKRKGHFPPK